MIVNMNDEKHELTLQSEVGRISNVLLKHAKEAFIDVNKVELEWSELNYNSAPNFSQSVNEYDQFSDLLASAGIETSYLAENEATTLDSIYVRDASVLCDKGAILCSMGKDARAGEPEALRPAYIEAGIPIVGAINGGGLLEGGDAVWIEERTLIVGQGYRTNADGIQQLKRMVGDSADKVIVVQLPHWRGPMDVFHLMSILSPVDVHKALIYAPLLPAILYQLLLDKGFELIEVPEDEFENMACNVLALSPGKCLMLSGNPKTRGLLEKAGIDVVEYEGFEISRKGAGGPTCLTRPTFRTSIRTP
jgi:N-dimethylarginine dimethylaminohydrolase